MTYFDLEGRSIKASSRSITAKDETGRTCGVCSAVRFLDLPPREQLDFSALLRKTGLWQAGLARFAYTSKGALFILRNTRPAEFYASRQHQEFDPAGYKKYLEREQVFSAARAAGIAVINVELLG